MAYNNRAQIWDQKGEPGRAIADFTTALTLDPNDASAFQGRGLAKRERVRVQVLRPTSRKRR
jgi:Flp pilus assembly protein TadD